MWSIPSLLPSHCPLLCPQRTTPDSVGLAYIFFKKIMTCTAVLLSNVSRSAEIPSWDSSFGLLSPESHNYLRMLFLKLCCWIIFKSSPTHRILSFTLFFSSFSGWVPCYDLNFLLRTLKICTINPHLAPKLQKHISNCLLISQHLKFKMFLTEITMSLFPQNTQTSSLVWKMTPPFTQARNLGTTESTLHLPIAQYPLSPATSFSIPNAKVQITITSWLGIQRVPNISH